MGWGLFADKDFAPGEPIFWLDLAEETRSYLLFALDAFGDCHDRSVTIVPGVAFCCTIQHPFWFVNHSCEENSGFANWGRIEDGRIPYVAYRPIRKGEQVVCDYAPITTSYDGSPEGDPWEMDCLCGAPGCRKHLGDFRHLPPELQLRAVFPGAEEPVQGRVLAHIMLGEPHLVAMLRQEGDGSAYRALMEAYNQQQTFAERYFVRRGRATVHIGAASSPAAD